IAIDASGNVWVADTGDNSVQKFSFTGGANGTRSAIDATSIAINGAGIAWATGNTTNNVYEFSSAVLSLGAFGGPNLEGPNGIALDHSGNIWVASGQNNTIVEFTSNGGAAPTGTNVYT